MRAAIYTRVSTRSQTTENQLPDLEGYARSMGWTVVHHYDEQVSGYKSERDRPQFRQLMEDASRRKFDVVLFWRLDRFSRETMVKTLVYLQQLTEWKVSYKSYTEPHLDTTGPLRDVITALLAYFNNLEFAAKSDRVKAGLKRAKEAGRVGGRQAVPAHILWKLEKLIEEGKSNRQIAKELNISHKTVNKYVKLLKSEVVSHEVEC